MKINPDFLDFIDCLNVYTVQYLVVGAYAVMIYAEPRATKDFDIWISSDKDNAVNLFNALKEFGAPLQLHEVNEDLFQQYGYGYRFGNPPNMIDILTKIDGVSFQDAWRNRKKGTLSGRSVHFISYQDLLKNKKASGRPQDLADIENLKNYKDV